MFYQLIEKKRNEWLASKECTITDLLHYIEQRGMMRDAQLEAIKTYLFLKIACQNQPLWQLFVNGYFNDTNIDQIELTEAARLFDNLDNLSKEVESPYPITMEELNQGLLRYFNTLA